jgi:uncharacterized protein
MDLLNPHSLVATIQGNYVGHAIMKFEWDEANRLASLDRYGIDFLDVEEIFDDSFVTVEDDRYSHGKQRFVTVGLMQARVVAIGYTNRGNAMRLISCRKATLYEQKNYYTKISN